MTFNPDALLLALWSILCVYVGSRLVKHQAAEAKEPFSPKKEPFSFVDEPGFMEDETLKEYDGGFRSINQGKVERKGEDE